MADFSSTDRQFLRRFLEEKFNLSELKTLSFDLGVDYEMFPHGTKPEFSRELIAYHERKGMLHSLVQELIRVRPDPTLTEILARVPVKDGLQKVQIILSNDKIQGKPDLRQKLAELLGVSMDEVMLIATAAGSVKLLVGLPPEGIARLEALPLPYMMAEYEIVSVTPFLTLPRPAQEGWRSAFEAAVRAAGGAAGAGAGLGLLGKVFLWSMGIIAVVLLVGGGTAAVWWNRLPRLTLINNCGQTLPIPLPEAGRQLIDLPPELVDGGDITFPVLSGQGTYRLELEKTARGEQLVLLLPRQVPIAATDRLVLGPADDDTRIRLDGELIRIPGSFPVRSGQSHRLILCAERR